MNQGSYRDSEAKTLAALSGAPQFNRWLAHTIRPHVGDRVLEIGCGIGNLTVALLPGVQRYIATDPNEEYLKQAADRVPGGSPVEFACCDLMRREDFAPFAGLIDTVLCVNVLEHLDGDGAGLANLFSFLGPGGRAIVLVPEGQSVFGSLDTALGHRRRYSEAGIKGKMEEVGFVVEHLIGFNRISRPAWWFCGKVLRQSSLGRLQMRIFDRMVWLGRRIDARRRWRPLSIIVIGSRR